MAASYRISSMVDVVDAATRSRMMAGIRGSNTKPEITLRRALHAQGLRFRLHGSHLPGRPDIVLPKWRAVILVHGCFWHRHSGCRYTTTPATRPEFWNEKFGKNVERDARNVRELVQADWRVAIVWECVIRSRGGEAIAVILKDWLHGGSSCLEIPDQLLTSR